MTERQLRKELIRVARSLHRRGYSHGTSGNLSVRLEGNEILITPTGSSFETLQLEELTRMTLEGEVLGGPKPSKEYPLHVAVYRACPEAGAVIHLHSTYAVALSCLNDVNPEDALPPLTPYYVMQIGRLPLIGYRRPGDPALGEEIQSRASGCKAVLLANHGMVVWGSSLREAMARAEEVEQHARLYFLLQDRARVLSREQIAELYETGLARK